MNQGFFLSLFHVSCLFCSFCYYWVSLFLLFFLLPMKNPAISGRVSFISQGLQYKLAAVLRFLPSSAPKHDRTGKLYRLLIAEKSGGGHRSVLVQRSKMDSGLIDPAADRNCFAFFALREKADFHLLGFPF